VSGRPAAERRAELVALYHELRDHQCPLAASRTNVVFGSGNADADLMFVGEAPGANEDRQGLPFVGNAGRLLDRLLEEIGLERGDAFIANVLKCRPPGNRDPLPEEIAECTPHLMRQIELIEPRVICTLGNFALKLLSGSKQGITKVHGEPQAHEIAGHGITLYPLFHPSAALRTPAVLDQLREDMGRLPELLAAARPEAPLPGPEPVGGERPASRTEPPGSSDHRPAADEDADDQLDLFG
jgi:DNA polymerase